MPGQSDESLIVDAITGRDGWRMPPESEGSSLSGDEIARLKTWIDQGARAQPTNSPSLTHATTGLSNHSGNPRFPPPARGSLCRLDQNPIDAFIAAEHRKHGLQPRPPADPATLIRRVAST